MDEPLEHRAEALARIDVTQSLVWDRSPEPFKDRYRQLALEHPRLALLCPVEATARHYRATEADGTPRMWRGKALQDVATALDVALEAIRP